MQEYAEENLIQSYNNEKDWQLQNKIAHGLSMCSLIHYCLNALRDQDLSDQQRNEVWKKVIDRWRKEPSDNHKSIEISHFRDALKARDENERKHGSEQKCPVLLENIENNRLVKTHYSQFVTISLILSTPPL